MERLGLTGRERLYDAAAYWRNSVLLAPDGIAPIQSITASSVMGWGAFIVSAGTFGMLVWQKITQRGRSLATIDDKIEQLCEKVEDMEGRLEVVDGLSQSVRELTQEWRGVAGDNGYRSIIRQHSNDIAAIIRRNDKIDAVREEDERRSGGQHRRKMDRALDPPAE